MKYLKFLFSGTFMGVLLIAFAVAIGYATFIENDYGAVTAKLLIYNAIWFEVLLFIMVVNFVGMVFTKKLYLRNKLNILIIHLALVVIIIGAGITRYIGFEGHMSIREGQSSNLFQSSDTYFQLQLKEENDSLRDDKKVLLSPFQSNLLHKSYNWKGNKIDVALTNYYPNAVQAIEKTTDGNRLISVIFGGNNGRHQIVLKEGDFKIMHTLGLSFGDTTRNELVQIIHKNDSLFIRFPMPSSHAKMGTNSSSSKTQPFKPFNIMDIQTHGSTFFLVKEFVENGRLSYVNDNNHKSGGMEIIKAKVNEKDVYIQLGQKRQVSVNDLEVSITVRNKQLYLPFSLELKDFVLDRYPGSNSPSSFASEVTLIDPNNGIEKSHRIFMNNILSYDGYRFYQSSYDNDEKGTVLSVNHDYWGTLITYIGYFLLFASLIASFFTKKTRFRKISRKIEKIHQKRKSLAMALFLTLILSTGAALAQIPSEPTTVVEAEHASMFGKLLIQNKAGRIEPINTASGKVLLKVHKKTSYNGFTADQVYLDMVLDAEKWKSEPIIKVDNPTIQKLLGIKDEYGSFNDFIDEKGQYKIRAQVEKANVKRPALRDTFDKALISIDERVNVCYMALNGSSMAIFPVADDPNNKWVTPGQFHTIAGHGTTEGDFFENYLKNLTKAKSTGDYNKANESIKLIGNFQRKIAQDIVPSELKSKLEIFYNNAQLFKKLFPVYLIVGILMVVLFFLQTFNPTYQFKVINKALMMVIGLVFLLHTFGLALRWYISGHEPWSNGYESMIYISWATILAGFSINKGSRIIVGVSALLSGITLLTAHMSWMNPEITNLVPVLKSYWLTFHVATITASYGFLALGCMLGFLNLCIMIFRNMANQIRINLVLSELTLIVEMSLIIGLVFLIIGNFLGGIWANESWGRYWGWDPKETWTLVTIIIYSFTLHTSLIPGLKNAFTFNFLSMISFGAVLMTYFGVNYFLSGLHSYANGDPIEIPMFVYYTLGIMLLVSILASLNNHKNGYNKARAVFTSAGSE